MEGFLGQIILVGFNFAPRGWAFCDGQFLQISQYQALYSILGTTYGGDGRTTFALPDLRGRVPVGPNNGTTNISLGEKLGAESVVLTTEQIPAHTHQAFSSSGIGNSTNPTNNLVANPQLQIDRGTSRDGKSYAVAGNEVAMNPAAIANQGGNQAHENRQPYLGLNYVICLEGFFPSRS